MEKAYVQVYTGDGKGKTTAAIGLCVRALGAGLSVYIGQFIKGMRYSEIQALEKFQSMGSDPVLKIEQYGRGCFIYRDPGPEDQAAATLGVGKALLAVKSGKYDLVILDEINVAHKIGLVTDADLDILLAARPETVELVLTGRYAPPLLLARADLVTEMRPIRHYYEIGVQARDGIER
ncbi:MAG: cob(I)alamin adenosyltransferase [Spirochaetes bacterium]|nr:MAG: cob(I)alamin adenosyltransferase [Spirochaetota bacterium]